MRRRSNGDGRNWSVKSKARDGGNVLITAGEIVAINLELDPKFWHADLPHLPRTCEAPPPAKIGQSK